MTNLFYPSLTLYLRKKYPPLHPPAPPSHNTHRIQAGPSRKLKKEHPLSLLSTPILDSFFPYPPPLLPRIPWTGWWESDTGQDASSTDDPGWIASRVVQNPADYDDEIRLMRIGWADVGDVLDRIGDQEEQEWLKRDYDLVNMVQRIAEDWEESQEGARCIRHFQSPTNHDREAKGTGPCYVMSPSLPPNLALDDLSHYSRRSFRIANSSDYPISWDPHAGDMYHSVSALFSVPRESITTFDDRWSDSLTSVARSLRGEVFLEPLGPNGGVGDQNGLWDLSVCFLDETTCGYACSCGSIKRLW